MPSSPRLYQGSYPVPEAPDTDGRVRAAFRPIARSRWFWVVARLVSPWDAAIKSAEWLKEHYPYAYDFDKAFSEAECRYASDRLLGFANYDSKKEGLIVLALSQTALIRLCRKATASHELLHLSRHVRGELLFGTWPPKWRRILEELFLLWLGFIYAPHVWIVLLVPFVILGILVALLTSYLIS